MQQAEGKGRERGTGSKALVHLLHGLVEGGTVVVDASTGVRRVRVEKGLWRRRIAVHQVQHARQSATEEEGVGRAQQSCASTGTAEDASCRYQTGVFSAIGKGLLELLGFLQDQQGQAWATLY